MLLAIIPAVDGGYTEWTVFSPCTAICSQDTGHRRRKRFCTNPEPSNGGLTCLRKFSASQIQFARSKHIFIFHIFAIISRPCFQLGHIFLQIPLKNPTSYLVEAGF